MRKIGRGPDWIPASYSGSSLPRLGFDLPKRTLNCAAATAICIALSACSTPAIKDRIVEVSVPIATHPVKPADVPTPPAPLPKRPDSLSAAADVLLSKWCEAVGYFLRADPLLRVSAGEKQQALPKYAECE